MKLLYLVTLYELKNDMNAFLALKRPFIEQPVLSYENQAQVMGWHKYLHSP